MSEIIGAIAGGAIGLALAGAYFLGRWHQMSEDHRLENDRLRRWGIIR